MRVYTVSHLMDDAVYPFAAAGSLTWAMKTVRSVLDSRLYAQVKVASHHVPGGTWEYTSFPEDGEWVLSFMAVPANPDGTPTQADRFDDVHGEWVEEDDWRVIQFVISRREVIESAEQLPLTAPSEVEP